MKRLVLAVALACTTPLTAQQPDTVRLAPSIDAALRLDPRFRQLELQRAQSSLRLGSLDAERLPTLSIEGQAQYQSDVTTIPVHVPGIDIPTPKRDTYDAHVNAQQRVFDPTRGARRAAERAQLAESDARVRVALYARRQEVIDAYFNAAQLQERIAIAQAAIADLQARLDETQIRLRERAALPSDAQSLEAEILTRRQDADELRANQDAALAILSQLTGAQYSARSLFLLPDLSRAVEQLQATSQPQLRPEYEQFARARERLAEQERVIAAQTQPRVSAFARAGYARPGLNFLNTSFDTYWLGGVQVQWSPWTWGTTGREREALRLQQEIVATEEAAFTDALTRGVARDRANIQRLQRTIESDERIIALRESIERETRLRFQEGVITAAEYIDRQNDVIAARELRAAHRVELAAAQARYLTTLGADL